jgi:MSHA biogenesis protein MshK
MAGLVKHSTIVVLLGLLSTGGAVAAGDPTRPPAAWLNQADLAPGNSGALRLQSVLMPQRGKPVAVIAGKTVPLGAAFGDAILVRLTEREAVLHGPDGVTRLYLTPDVDKQMIVAPAGGKARQPAQGKERR